MATSNSQAPTFAEHIAVLAAESPAAAILDWWRRLDLASREHFRLYHGRGARNHVELEQHIVDYPGLGAAVCGRVATLRRRRNRVAHERVGSLSREEAMMYARRAFDVIGAFGRAWPDDQVELKTAKSADASVWVGRRSSFLKRTLAKNGQSSSRGCEKTISRKIGGN